MAHALTLSQIQTKVQNDLDLIDEAFITTTELTGYINEAIKKCEAEIHGLYEDYFLTSAYLPITASTASYSMPSDIYGKKIRRLIYDNAPGVVGGIKYSIKRIRNLDEVPFLVQTGTNYLKYLIDNSAASGDKIHFYPTPNETSATNITAWYIREAKQLSGDSDVCDIPEFVEFVIQYTKMRCYEKEGHPNYQVAKMDMEQLRKDMVDTLANMVPDEDTMILKDLSFYADFDMDDYAY